MEHLPEVKQLSRQGYVKIPQPAVGCGQPGVWNEKTERLWVQMVEGEELVLHGHLNSAAETDKTMACLPRATWLDKQGAQGRPGAEGDNSPGTPSLSYVSDVSFVTSQRDLDTIICLGSVCHARLSCPSRPWPLDLSGNDYF